MKFDIDSINRSDESGFVELLAAVFEHSAWVPAKVYRERPFASRNDLHQSMCRVVRNASEAERLTLLRSHPELAGKEAQAGRLTDASQREQAGAGLDRCSSSELEQIKSLNRRYCKRFDFPFIIAVGGLDKFQIISAMQQRLDHERAEEIEIALAEVEKIARIRIDSLIDAAANDA